MKEKIKLLIVNEACQLEFFSRRWQLFAKEHPNVDVTLMIPSKSTWFKGTKYTFGKTFEVEGKPVDDNNYHVRTFKRIFKRTWLSKDYKKEFLRVQPDVVYHIGFHWQPSLCQVGNIVKKHLPNTKLILFSMRGPAFDLSNRHGLEKLIATYVVKYVNKYYDAVFCHYPEAVNCFKREGYNGRIYIQTSVGVNTEWFFPNEEGGKEIRSKYNIPDDAFVFGSATRFSPEKGIDDIIAALPSEGNWKYLMMGSGTEEEINHLKALVKEKGIDDKIIMPGYIDRFEMAKYWNAINCAIHVPRTTQEWCETFSLAAIQPQAIKKPVIGNTSGSVPYQIGFPEMIVPEGDIESLKEKIVYIMTHKVEAKEIGEKMYDRTIHSFSVKHLNNMFYDTIMDDILNDTYDEKKVDMVYYNKTINHKNESTD